MDRFYRRCGLPVKWRQEMSHSSYLRVHLRVEGRVQGVGFRYHTQAKATEIEVRGWVKNLPSGEVEVLAEGAEENVRALLAWLDQGPAAARVDKKMILGERVVETCEFKSFEVRR